ncbi:class I SAM-dependent methyltransferase [Bradyrhizobium iriomotense]|uniref:class I SAM-dependent methyltransferase n=1 Tax=Bradyrhizobium iriomotense TaxID=441950 RepID=UPI001B8A51AE|nr:class I SAM-dependent methyltransferase [Bradyrhizobium iriomotense]MBR1130058.1 methyltransferase domain-containing protein [Bradyrhizobium iriomotense]
MTRSVESGATGGADTTSYDQAIRAHYDSVAGKAGLSPQSTMEDERLRALETEAIHGFVEAAARALLARTPPLEGVRLVDVGCGNGYTLSTLAEKRGLSQLVGIEQNDSQRMLASQRPGVEIRAGDVRQPRFYDDLADIVVCQRVLINLLDLRDQQAALANIIDIVRPGGYLIFIECFELALANLNAARQEFGFSLIPPAEHNLYLPDDFFETKRLLPLREPFWEITPQHFSTHYFTSRVLHDIALNACGAEFRRNSHFVRFMSQALPSGIGDYAPLKVMAFRKSEGT